MAKIVGVFGAGHTPNLVNTWDKAGQAICDETRAAFNEMGRRIRAAGATTLLTISNDHFNNFFLNNLPAYAIGVGDSWTGPEDDLRYEGPPVKIPGNPGLAGHLVRCMYEQEGFDPAVSY